MNNFSSVLPAVKEYGGDKDIIRRDCCFEAISGAIQTPLNNPEFYLEKLGLTGISRMVDKLHQAKKQ